MTLGQFIREVRTKKNLSQGDVAKKAELARSYISRLEEDEFKSPSVMTLIRLANGLGVSNEALFTVAGVQVRENNAPAFDVYCRTQLGLPEEGVEEMKKFLELLKLKYVNRHK